ncbi:transposase [Enterococcus sp. 669A]|uniref:Transposase n=1 Tax=Candidatus Enterococcus moelleringii TaxID=2815325 RepID=A0ABS3LHU8_9ENTE|nr:transposase [Enterococcus sp. 669A]MBO1307939.1 transposase [Enterococcus sp. 669A]
MDMNKAKMINDAVVSTVERKAEERGIERGIKEGREEVKIEVALYMLEKGLPLEVITDVTGLTVAELEDLQKN